MAKRWRIGLLGLGTVGQGVAKLVLDGGDGLAARSGFQLELARVADIDIDRPRDVAVDRSLMTTDALSVCTAADIDVVVELIGGKTAARELVLAALAAGKPVVTANKALLAEHGLEIFRAAQDAGVSVSFEASTGGGIPLLSSVRDGLVANEIRELHGIVNGTANYVLTRMLADEMPLDEAVKQAQQLGYAEADPTFDIEGIDSAHKLTLLAELAFHTPVDFHAIYVEGISRIRPADIRYAQQLGYVIKLLAIAKQVRGNAPDGNGNGIELRVHPTLLRHDHPLAAVRDNFNAVLLVGDAVGPVMFYGQGAGRMPTASAIVADIIDVARGSAAQTFKQLTFFREGSRALRQAPMDEITTRYFVRVTCEDKAGVLGRVATHLGEQGVSVASIIQKEFGAPTVPLIILTHTAVEKNFRAALARIDAEPFVTEPSAFIRVEAEE